MPQVLSVYAWQRETNDSFKKVISQIIAEAMLNISSILNNFKSIIKKVYQKEWMQNIKKKKDQNNYFIAEISHKEEQRLRVKVKKKIDF